MFFRIETFKQIIALNKALSLIAVARDRITRKQHYMAMWTQINFALLYWHIGKIFIGLQPNKTRAELDSSTRSWIIFETNILRVSAPVNKICMKIALA